MNRYFLALAIAVLVTACSSNPKPRTEIVDPATAQPVDLVLDTAMRHLGAPYRFGGMSSDGFDCSGLACASFDAAGVALPRVSRDQSKVGSPVKRSELRRGDLVFFSSSGTINHVGIVSTVDGPHVVFIHATTRSGVRTDRLDTGHWRDRYVTARRIALR